MYISSEDINSILVYEVVNQELLQPLINLQIENKVYFADLRKM